MPISIPIPPLAARFVPFFYISHRDQLAAPLSYLADASSSFAEHSIAVHSVDRPSEEGFLPAELNRSLIFTYNWVSGELPPRLGNATYDPPTSVGSGTLTDISVPLEVVSLEIDFGNLEFEDSYEILEPLNLEQGDLVAIRFGEEVRFARYTDRFNGVPENDWAFEVIPGGQLRASIFMGNASEDIGAVPGDTVEIVQVLQD